MNETQRISKSQGRFMIAVAILFDVIPILLIIVLLMFGMYEIAQIDGIDVLIEDAKTVQGYGDLSLWEKIKATPGVLMAGGRLAKTLATGVIAGAIAGLIFIPLIYTGASFMSTLTAYLLFTVWFLSLIHI